MGEKGTSHRVRKNVLNRCKQTSATSIRQSLTMTAVLGKVSNSNKDLDTDLIVQLDESGSSKDSQNSTACSRAFSQYLGQHLYHLYTSVYCYYLQQNLTSFIKVRNLEKESPPNGRARRDVRGLHKSLGRRIECDGHS